MPDTEHLSKSPRNRRRLIAAIKQLEAGHGLIFPNLAGVHKAAAEARPYITKSRALGLRRGLTYDKIPKLLSAGK